MQQYWPLGLRTGGFEPAMLAAERLEYFEAVVLNRANKDLLKIGIETDLLGYAMVRPPSRRVSGWRGGRGALRLKSAASSSFALSVLMLIALHSLADCPTG